MLDLAVFLVFWGTWSLTCLAGITYLVLVPKDKQSILTILVIVASLVISIYTLGISLWVFAIGGSSHIRQIAGESGYQMWVMWKDSWPKLLLLNPLSILLALISAYLPPSSRENRDWLWLRFFVLMGAVISVCLTLGKLPNAYAAADFWR
jgi:hypothetical protein